MIQTNGTTVERIQKASGEGFQNKAINLLSQGMASKGNILKAVTEEQIYSASISLQLPSYLESKLARVCERNRISAAAFLAGCAMIYAR